MDRRRGAVKRAGPGAAIAAALAAALAAGCGGGPARVVARGVLPYGAAWRGEELVTVELAEQFELVVRRGPDLAVAARVALGPPELDLRALAVVDALALVGGDDGWLRRIDLASRRERDRWPQGAAITAVAADAAYVVIADAGGALCVRRATGELLQCAAQDVAIAGLAIDGEVVVATTAAGARRAFALPGLTRRPAPPAPTWRRGALDAPLGGRVARWRGPDGRSRRLAAFAAPIRAVAASPGGKLVIAGWVRRLDQPAVVVWLAPPR